MNETYAVQLVNCDLATGSVSDNDADERNIIADIAVDNNMSRLTDCPLERSGRLG